MIPLYRIRLCHSLLPQTNMYALVYTKLEKLLFSSMICNASKSEDRFEIIRQGGKIYDTYVDVTFGSVLDRKRNDQPAQIFTNKAKSTLKCLVNNKLGISQRKIARRLPKAKLSKVSQQRAQVNVYQLLGKTNHSRPN
ncbi:hypothetical protein BpHYR1_031431 [Brachionus plicatilis]|uniref:Uncharacterized protein n=1 Tax=Brachionus plicatilis TaxID=10195 RepID=A0A3M7RAY5_BRAPC|nr:hypothetical protein BpHYR1_031431 [Brachionus plicatilis]